MLFVKASKGAGRLAAVYLLLVMVTAASAQNRLAFDVASVRPTTVGQAESNVPLGPGSVYGPTGGVLRAINFPLVQFLVFAYKLTDYQRTAFEAAAPGWVLTEHFSIEARTENRKVTKDELRLMMQTLLADRFKIAVHYEKRDVKVYALELAKTGALGPQLRVHGGECQQYDPNAKDSDGKPVEPKLQASKGEFPTICGGILDLPGSAPDRYSFGAANVAMSLIVGALASWGNLGRPVIDRTGLQARYDFVLDFTPDPRPAYAVVDSGGPGFQEAVQKQLGLRLDPQRGLVEFLALDHIERPTQN